MPTGVRSIQKFSVLIRTKLYMVLYLETTVSIQLTLFIRNVGTMKLDKLISFDVSMQAHYPHCVL